MSKFMSVIDYSTRTNTLSISVILLSVAILVSACSATKKVAEVVESSPSKMPVLTFDLDTIDLGDLVEGEKRTMAYTFKNTGTDTLQIDLATACKCTDLRWTQDAIPPGGRGTIEVEFDSTNFSGNVKKTIDVIANTEPLVTEVFFTALVVKKQ
jgi:hypothetical protein